MFRKYQDKPQFYIILLVILGFVALWLFYPKPLINWIKTPNEVTKCTILCNDGNTIDSVTLFADEQSEELNQLLHDISQVTVQYTRPYKCIKFEDGKPVYHFYFWNGNEELGCMNINGTTVYGDLGCRYRITGEQVLFLSSVLDARFPILLEKQEDTK